MSDAAHPRGGEYAPRPRPSPVWGNCAQCSARVDTLRTRHLVLTSRGFRFFCTPACRRSFQEHHITDAELNEQNAHHYIGAVPSSRSTLTKDLTGQFKIQRDLEAVHHEPRLTSPESARPPFRFLVWVGVAAVFAALSPTLEIFGWLSGACSAGGVIHFGWERFNQLSTQRNKFHTSVWPLLVASLGVALLVLAGLLSIGEHGAEAFLLLASAALSTGILVGRFRLAETTHRPLEVAVKTLAANLPTHARVATAGADNGPEMDFEQVPLSALRSGMEVLVIEGERIPVDGVVQRGEGVIFTSSHSLRPATKKAGDAVLAGALLTSGAVRVLAARVGKDRSLETPTALLQGDGQHTARLLGIGRWFPAAAAALVITAVALTLAGLNPFLSDRPFVMLLSAAASILLGLPYLTLREAGPRIATTAICAALRRGFVFASPTALDLAGKTSTVALPVRGTITEGQPEMLGIYPLENENADELLAVASAAEEAGDKHPIARAIRAVAQERGVTPAVLRRSQRVPGRGISAVTALGQTVVIGHRSFLLDDGVSVALAEHEAQREEARGHSVVFLALDGHVRAVLSFLDVTRPGARAAVQRLFDMGMEVVLCSADHRGTVETLAKTLDVTNVRADLARADRGQELKLLRDTGEVVATVGRLDRDDEALIAADVPVLLNAAGAAQREESVALDSDDVRDAASALFLARAARKTMVRIQALTIGSGTLFVLMGVFSSWNPVVAGLATWGIEAIGFLAAPRLGRRLDRRIPPRS